MSDNRELYLWLAVMGFIIAACVLALLGALAHAQTSGEAPVFTCDPGGVYTTKECP